MTSVRDDNAKVPVSLSYRDWGLIMHEMISLEATADYDGESELATQAREIYREVGRVFGE